jgi:hypothetical protein
MQGANSFKVAYPVESAVVFLATKRLISSINTDSLWNNGFNFKAEIVFGFET